MKRRHLLTAALASAALTLTMPSLLAQDGYPSRPIELIVPVAAGGSADLVARTFADALEKKWNAKINVVNRPGGNSVIAIDALMAAKPDGYTVMLDSIIASSLVSIAVPDLPYKITDRTFFAQATKVPMAIITSAETEQKTLPDFANWITQNPTQFSWASLGGVGTNDVAIRGLLKDIGVDATQTKPVVSSGGGSATVVAVAGNHVKMGVASYTAIASLLKAGKIHPLAVTGTTRHAVLPDTPSAGELGYGSVAAVTNWQGFSGPPNTPAEIATAWETAIGELSKDPAVVETLANLGVESSYENGAAMRQRVENEIALFTSTK